MIPGECPGAFAVRYEIGENRLFQDIRCAAVRSHRIDHAEQCKEKNAGQTRCERESETARSREKGQRDERAFTSDAVGAPCNESGRDRHCRQAHGRYRADVNAAVTEPEQVHAKHDGDESCVERTQERRHI